MRLLSVFIVLLFAVSAGHAETLTGHIVWQGKKVVNTKTRVESGAHLTIQPGSTVVFKNGGLEVAGRLTARGVTFKGDKWGGIVLKGCGLDTLIAESVVTGAKIGIQVVGGEPRLEELTLKNNDVGVELRQQSEATVAGSSFIDNRKVGLFIKDGAAAAVLNNRFEKNGKYGAYIFRSTPRRFAGNVFSHHETALMVAYSGSEPELRDNCFDHNKLAIRVEKAARPLITGSDISNNGIGISLYRRADPKIVNNLLARNDIGIEIAFSSYPEISANDFIENGKALFLEYQSTQWEQSKGAKARQAESNRSAFGSLEKSTSGVAAPRKLDGTVDARGNWWGISGTKELGGIGPEGNPTFIDDGRDRPTFIEEGDEYPLDRVDFGNWLKKAVYGGASK